MTRAVKGLAILSLLAAFAIAHADETGTAPPEAEEDGMEVVLVTGVQPGPALWKVSSGDHVLWILGEVTPIPRRVKWRSERFEKLLSGSQELLVDVTDDLPDTLSPLQAAAAHRAKSLPRGQTLRDVLSPQMYAHVKAMQKKFRTREIESLRPWAAMSWIVDSAIYSLGLVEFSAPDTAKRLALKAKVPITTFTFRLTVDERLEYLGSAPPNDDCMLPAVRTFGDGGAGVRRLANAWSVGDIARLRKLVPAYAGVSESWGPGQLNECQQGGPQRAREFFEQRTTAWLKESERALRDNRSTMAVMPIGWLVAPDGYVAQLRAKGYEVVEPE